MPLTSNKIAKIIDACNESASILLKYFNSDADLEIESKKDSSPVTKADTESSDNLIRALPKILDLPVMSEENTQAVNLDILKNHNKFWLIDPLDGTWSYIRGRDTFVINIALIENGEPIWGMIGMPVQDKIYYIDEHDELCISHCGKSHKIKQPAPNAERIDFLVSSRNLTQKLEDFINQFEHKTVTPLASAIKFCIIAEGNADIYPRFKPTYSWDTAAGHALLRNIDGTILDANTFKELKYNKKLLNPDFIALRDKNIYLP